VANGTRTRDPQIHNQPTAGRNPQQNADLRHGGFSVAQPVAHERGKAADSGAAEPAAIDPDLAAVITSWRILPAAIRAGILAMVKAQPPLTMGRAKENV
jgi:hypothetical protein